MDPIGMCNTYGRADLQRRDLKDTAGQKGYSAPTIPVLEVWKPVQQEVRNLLYMYLADDSQGSVLERHQILSVNEVLRDGKTARDRQRVCRADFTWLTISADV
jgi:exocyst complex component 4